jgi:hypothetical protein
MGDDGRSDRTRAEGFDLAGLASFARPREVTGATFSYVDAMLTGSMSEADLERIRADLLGDGADAPRDPEVERMEALVARGDDTGALVAAEAFLAAKPDHPGAARIAEDCRRRLGDLYQRHLGAGHDVPRLLVPTHSLGEHGIDRWAAYLISRFDDAVAIDDLVQLTGFSRLDTLRLLYELVQRGLVMVERRPPPSSQRSDSAVLARVKLKRTQG